MATRGRKASAAPHRTPMQWEIWQVNQVASRAATSPPTPPDPDKNERPFIVISPNAYNRGGLDSRVAQKIYQSLSDLGRKTYEAMPI